MTETGTADCRKSDFALPSAEMAAASLANSADYADALLSARRAKNVLVGLILLILVVQTGLFFAARYKIDLASQERGVGFQYVVDVTDFLGVVLPIVLGVVLLLIILIMLLGRLLGVASVVSAFVACVVLAALMFPWQALFSAQGYGSNDVRIPGILYTWPELVARARLYPDDLLKKLLFWARFVGWPVAALLILVKIYLKSASGLRAAIVVPAKAPVEPVVQPPDAM
jgi:hypothetical protein